MINKSEWSLKAYTDKDINTKIISINEHHLNQQQFVKLLARKEQYQSSYLAIEPDQLLKIINCKTKKFKEEDMSNFCSICLQSLSSYKYWCKICGSITCKKCLIRQRQLKDQTKALFCEKCDNEHLKAMLNITFFNKTQLYNRTFLRLAKQLQNLEELLSIQKTKLINKGQRNDDAKRLIETGKHSSNILEENKIIKLQNQQLLKKLQFGKNINATLKKKLHLLKKKQRQSFGTMSNNEEYLSDAAEPAKIDLNISIEELRDSILTVQQRHVDNDKLSYMDKCKCIIY